MSILLILLSITLLSMRPIPIATAENTCEIKGKISAISNPESNHIYIILKGDKHLYYIKNGINKGLNIKELSKEILNKNVSITIVKKPWSVMDPWYRNMPVIALSNNSKEYFQLIEY